MARRRKKKNIFKPMVNLIVLLLLLFVIFFLVQKLIIPLWQDKWATEKVPEIKEDQETLEQKPNIEVALYFADQNAQYLIPEYREIDQTNDPEKQAIIELIRGPKDNRLYPTMPRTTKVNALYISEGIAYIDLSSELIEDHPGGSTGELLTVYSIVMTLTSFSEIDKVQILVDGNSGETLVGHIDISVPLDRDEQWLKK